MPIARRRGIRRFFHVHETKATFRFLPDPEYNGESQTTQRTAAFDPVRRIENLDAGIVIATPQHCRELSYILLHEELPDC
jgi:hypothetical protein